MRILILILAIAYCFSIPTYRTKDDLSCAQYEELKKDCGYIGINQKTCEERGCCWKESSNPKTPWCFEGINDVPTFTTNTKKMCHLDRDLRKECGYKGIDKEECESRDCCWQIDEYESTVPWCYHGYIDSLEKKNKNDIEMDFGGDE